MVKLVTSMEDRWSMVMGDQGSSLIGVVVGGAGRFGGERASELRSCIKILTFLSKSSKILRYMCVLLVYINDQIYGCERALFNYFGKEVVL